MSKALDLNCSGSSAARINHITGLWWNREATPTNGESLWFHEEASTENVCEFITVKRGDAERRLRSVYVSKDSFAILTVDGA